MRLMNWEWAFSEAGSASPDLGKPAETPVGCAGLLFFGSSRFLKNLMETSNDVVTENGSILPLSGRGLYLGNEILCLQSILSTYLVLIIDQVTVEQRHSAFQLDSLASANEKSYLLICCKGG